MVFQKSHTFIVCFFLKISERSTSPRWDEGFHFLVSDPRSEILTVKVRDAFDSHHLLGHVVSKLKHFTQIKEVENVCVYLYVCVSL